MKFVIIGGDAAGMSAASKAKRIAPDMGVTVLEKTQDVSYSACGMPYQIAEPDKAMDDLVVRSAKVFREKYNIDLLTGHTVTKIDRTGRTVSGVVEGSDKSFSIAYDRLLIATGAAAALPDIPGLDLPQVMVLKSLEQGRQIKHRIDHSNVKTAVIIGMGYIALEMCETFGKRGIHTTMIKPGKKFLPWLDPKLAEVVQDTLENHQVDINMGCAVTAIQPDGTRVRVICENREITADMVLVATGITPCSDLAGQAGLNLGTSNAISVDQHLKTSDDHIYAAGDCADAIHVVTGKNVWIPLALRANRAGWAVADNICKIPTRLPGITGTSVFKVFELEVARTGLNTREAEKEGFSPVAAWIETVSRAHGQALAKPIRVSMVADKKTNRLLGAQMVGEEGVAHRINAVSVALHAGMTVQDFYQTDMAYAPPFGPVWDPLLTAAGQVLKKF